MKLLGQDVIFSLAGCPIAFSTGCDVETNTNFIETCSPVSGGDTECIPATFSWSISASYLCANLADEARLIALQRANTRFEVRIFDRTLSTVLTGYCYIKNLRLTCKKNSLAQFSASYQPTGGLTEVEPTRIADAGKTRRDIYISGGGSTHRFVHDTSGVSNGMLIIPLTVTSLSALIVDYKETMYNPLLVCRPSSSSGGDIEVDIQYAITSGSMLNFYKKCELYYVDRVGEDKRVLQPGKYYILHNVTNEEHEHKILGSLPL